MSSRIVKAGAIVPLMMSLLLLTPSQSFAKNKQPDKFIDVTGYIQLSYQRFTQPLDGGEPIRGYDVERARVKIAVHPLDRLKAVVSYDFVDEVFKDVYAKYDLPSKREIAFGQMKWPFGYEVTNSSSDRETPDRALVFKRFFPGQRDRGATLEGEFNQNMDWTFGVFDGSGTGEVYEPIIDAWGIPVGLSSKTITSDYNHHKDVVMHLTWERGNAELGLSSYVGRGVWNNKQTAMLDVPKDRYGAEYRYYGDKWVLKTEYVRGRGVDNANKNYNQAQWIDGWYGQLGYYVDSNNELVVRYSNMSQDPNEPQFGRRSAWDLGCLRWLNKTNRVRFFYEINEESENPINNNGFILDWQIEY